MSGRRDARVRVRLALALGLIWAGALADNVHAQAYLEVEARALSTNALVTGDLYLGNFNALECDLFLAPLYLRLNYPTDNPTAWGIQIYTDNRNSLGSWNSSSGIYGGLRGMTEPDELVLPLYWQAYGQLQDVIASWGTPSSVTLTAGGLAFNPQTLNYWGRVQDRSDQDIAGLWMSQSVLTNRTVINRQGQLAPYPRVGRTAYAAPIYLYFGLDMRGAQASNYETLLYLDLYNLGVDLSTGGYATPNPFTPATGQRTSFNVFLQDVHSAYAIRIFTVRGRLIRTITDTTEWDGRMDNGQLVEGGLYIYQIEAEGKRASGTVVVIK